MHVGHRLVIVGQETSIRKDQLEAVVQKTVFVECQDEPSQCFVGRSYFLSHLGIDILHTAVVLEVLGNEVPVMCNFICRLSFEKAVLKEVIQDDNQIPEQLINGRLFSILTSSLPGSTCISQ